MRPVQFAVVRPVVMRVVAGIAIDAILSAACFALHLNLATVSLLFLLSVVFQALTATFASSLAVSIIAAGFLDYFFVAPLFKWRIASPFDAVALSVFVTTSLVITRLASKACAEKQKAEYRLRMLEQIYQCSERLLTLDPEPGVIEAVLNVYRQSFNLRAVSYFDGHRAEMWIQGRSSQLSEQTRQAFIASNDIDDAGRQLCVRCIRLKGQVTAAIGFEGLPDPHLTSRSLVAMTVATLDRANAFHAASTSAAEVKAESFRAAVLDALAHEIRTPLASIVTAAGAICETVAAPQQELAQEIESEALRLSELTSTLMRKAALEFTDLEARMVETDLGAMLQALVERYSLRQAGDHAFAFECSGSGAERVIADQDLLRLAVAQLLDNAVKYSEPGSLIAVNLESSEESVAVLVRNEGRPILAAERAYIFERFYRGTRGVSVPGTGLGLHIAKKIARAHQGTLTLDGEEKRTGGVVFRLTLPKPEAETEHGKLEYQSADSGR